MGEKPHTLTEITEIVREFVRERNWEQYNRPLNLAISTSIEVGELLELFQWKTDADVEEALKDERFREALASEIADVLIYLLRVADTTGIDPTKAVIEKMKKNSKKYPVDYWEGRAPSKFNRPE
ncbi:MAG: nucleotide pyrophosphohydrolase [Candidatus Thorarchaeota archaeon]|nr:nucleotide pyrophosphohydrolase [Candidatus Thorarchaeota archaeon]